MDLLDQLYNRLVSADNDKFAEIINRLLPRLLGQSEKFGSQPQFLRTLNYLSTRIRDTQQIKLQLDELLPLVSIFRPSICSNLALNFIDIFVDRTSPGDVISVSSIIVTLIGRVNEFPNFCFSQNVILCMFLRFLQVFSNYAAAESFMLSLNDKFLLNRLELVIDLFVDVMLLQLPILSRNALGSVQSGMSIASVDRLLCRKEQWTTSDIKLSKSEVISFLSLQIDLILAPQLETSATSLIFQHTCNCGSNSCKHRVCKSNHIIGGLRMIILPLIIGISESNINLFEISKIEVTMNQKNGTISSCVVDSYDILERVGSFVSSLISTTFLSFKAKPVCCGSYHEIIMMMSSIMKLILSESLIVDNSDVKFRRTLVSLSLRFGCLSWLAKHMLPFSLAHVATSASLKGVIFTCSVLFHKCGQHPEYIESFNSLLSLLSISLFMSCLSINQKIDIVELDVWSLQTGGRVEFDRSEFVGKLADSSRLIAFKISASVLAQLNQARQHADCHVNQISVFVRSVLMSAVHYLSTTRQLLQTDDDSNSTTNLALKYQKRKKKDMTVLSGDVGEDLSNLEDKKNDDESEVCRNICYWSVAFVCTNYCMLTEDNDVMYRAFCKLAVVLLDLALVEHHKYLGRLSECHSLVILGMKQLLKSPIEAASTNSNIIVQLMKRVFQLSTLTIPLDKILAVVDETSDTFIRDLCQLAQYSVDSSLFAQVRQTIGLVWAREMLPCMPDVTMVENCATTSSLSQLIGFLKVLHDPEPVIVEPMILVQMRELTGKCSDCFNQQDKDLFLRIAGLSEHSPTTSVKSVVQFMKWIPVAKILRYSFSANEFNNAMGWYFKLIMPAMTEEGFKSSQFAIMALEVLEFLSSCNYQGQKREADACFHFIGVYLYRQHDLGFDLDEVTLSSVSNSLNRAGHLRMAADFNEDAVGLVCIMLHRHYGRNTNPMVIDVRALLNCISSQESLSSKLWLLTCCVICCDQADEIIDPVFQLFNDQLLLPMTCRTFELMNASIVALAVGLLNSRTDIDMSLGHFVNLSMALSSSIDIESDSSILKFRLACNLQSLLALLCNGKEELLVQSISLLPTALAKIINLCSSWDAAFLVGKSVNLVLKSVTTLHSNCIGCADLFSKIFKSLVSCREDRYCYGVILSILNNFLSFSNQDEGPADIAELLQTYGKELMLHLEEIFLQECVKLSNDSSNSELLWVISSCIAMFNQVDEVDVWKQGIAFKQFGIFSNLLSISDVRPASQPDMMLYRSIYQFVTEFRSLQGHARIVSFKNDILLSVVICLSKLSPYENIDLRFNQINPKQFLLQLRSSPVSVCGLCFLAVTAKHEDNNANQAIDVGISALYDAVCEVEAQPGINGEFQLLVENFDFMIRYAIEVKSQHRTWQERERCCHFLSHILDVWQRKAMNDSIFSFKENDEGVMMQLLDSIMPFLESLWRAAFHLMDDIRDSVRSAAMSVLAPQLTRICKMILECDSQSIGHRIVEFGRILVSPVLFEVGFLQKSDAVYSVSVSLLLMVITSNKTIGIDKFHLEQHFTSIIDILMTINADTTVAANSSYLESKSRKEHSRVDAPKIMLTIIDEISHGISNETFKNSGFIFAKLLTLTRNFALDAISGISFSSTASVSSSSNMMDALLSGLGDISRKSLRVILEDASSDSLVWDAIRNAMTGMLDAVFFRGAKQSSSTAMRCRNQCCDVFATIVKCCNRFTDLGANLALNGIVSFVCTYPLTFVLAELNSSLGAGPSYSSQSEIDFARLEVAIMALNSLMEACVASRRVVAQLSHHYQNQCENVFMLLLVLLLSLKEFRRSPLNHGKSLSGVSMADLPDDIDNTAEPDDRHDNIRQTCNTLYVSLNTSLFRHDLTVELAACAMDCVIEEFAFILGSRNWTLRTMGAASICEIFGNATASSYIYHLFHNDQIDGAKQLQQQKVNQVLLLLINLLKEGFNWNGYEYVLKAVVIIAVSPGRFVNLVEDHDDQFFSRAILVDDAPNNQLKLAGYDLNVVVLFSLLMGRMSSKSVVYEKTLLLSTISLISQCDMQVTLNWVMEWLTKIWRNHQDGKEASKSTLSLKIHLVAACIMKFKAVDIESLYLPSMRLLFESIVSFGVFVEVSESSRFLFASMIYFCDKLLEKMCNIILRHGISSELSRLCFVHILTGCETVVGYSSSLKYNKNFHASIVSFIASIGNWFQMVVSNFSGSLTEESVALIALIRKFVLDIRILQELGNSGDNQKNELDVCAETMEAIERQLM